MQDVLFTIEYFVKIKELKKPINDTMSNKLNNLIKKKKDLDIEKNAIIFLRDSGTKNEKYIFFDKLLFAN